MKFKDDFGYPLGCDWDDDYTKVIELGLRNWQTQYVHFLLDIL